MFAKKERAVAQISWANRNLNTEQKTAVKEIVTGKCRPLAFTCAQLGRHVVHAVREPKTFNKLGSAFERTVG